MSLTKIINTKEESIIHIHNVTEKDMVIAKREGKIIASIAHDGNGWICTCIGEEHWKRNNLYDLFINLLLSDCEFYVLK